MATVTYALERAPVSGSQHIVLSTDEGLTWSDSPYVIAGAPYWKDICAFPVFSTRAIGANGTNIYYTIDGGLSWTASGGTYAGGDTSPILFAASALVSYSAGENIAKSIDSGVTFDQLITVAAITGNPGNVATSIFFQSDTYGFIGVGNKVYATTDGGFSWTIINGGNDIAFGEPVRSIASDASVGIIVSTNLTILRSIDGGVTFTVTQVLPTLNTAAINYIKKVTPQVYYITLDQVTGSSSNVFKTINGGDTWVAQGQTSRQVGRADLVLYNTTTGLNLGKSGGNDINRTTNSFIAPTPSVYTARPIIKISADAYECGVCPDGYVYNETTDTCEGILTTIACPAGYAYDIPSEKCVQLIAPFASVSTNCGSCPVEIVQDIAYCVCIEEIDIFPCCFLLTNCANPSVQITTQTDLSEYEGQVIQLAEYPNVCWSFEKVDGLCQDQETVTVTGNFPSCQECNPSYKIYSCEDKTIVYYTESDLSTFVEPSKVTHFVELPNTCWKVGINFDFPYTPITLTPKGETFEDCVDCQFNLYQLTNCTNNDIVLISNTNLENYLGAVVQIGDYPGLCWEVSKLKCDCIEVSIIGITSFVVQVNSTGFVNNRPVYLFSNGGNNYGIYYDADTERWVLENTTTEVILSYINITNNCPFSGSWSSLTPGGTTVESINPCTTSIYDVTVTLVYLDCDCCLNNCK